MALRLGGDLEIKSEYGVGSTFTLTIAMGSIKEPIWHYEDLKDAAPSTDLDGSILLLNEVHQLVANYVSTLESFNLLIIDDDAHAIEILTAYMSPYSPIISAAINGEEATKLLNTRRFDMVIVDYYMPGMTGPAFIKTLRENDKNKNAIVLCVTGGTKADIIQSIYSAGADLHLSKPISVEDLIRGIGEVIGKRESEMD